MHSVIRHIAAHRFTDEHFHDLPGLPCLRSFLGPVLSLLVPVF